MKKLIALSCSIIFALSSCEKEETDTFNAEIGAKQNEDEQLELNQRPTIFIDEFKVETCSRPLLGNVEGGSITGGNSAGAFEIPNQGPIFYKLADEDGNLIDPNLIFPSVEDDGTFIFRRIPDGVYRVVAFIGLDAAFEQDVDSAIVSELITVGCGDNPNINPIAQEDYSPANFKVGEVRFIDLLANDIDVDGDEITLVSAQEGIFPSFRGGKYEFKLVGNKMRITRLEGGNSGAFFRLRYRITDGRGGFDQGILRFGAPRGGNI